MGNLLRITIVVCLALSNVHCGQKGGLTRPLKPVLPHHSVIEPLFITQIIGDFSEYMEHFSYKDNNLLVEDASIASVAEKYGTPCFFCNQPVLANCYLCREVFHGSLITVGSSMTVILVIQPEKR